MQLQWESKSTKMHSSVQRRLIWGSSSLNETKQEHIFQSYSLFSAFPLCCCISPLQLIKDILSGDTIWASFVLDIHLICLTQTTEATCSALAELSCIIARKLDSGLHLLYTYFGVILNKQIPVSVVIITWYLNIALFTQREISMISTEFAVYIHTYHLIRVYLATVIINLLLFSTSLLWPPTYCKYLFREEEKSVRNTERTVCTNSESKHYWLLLLCLITQ